MAANLEEERADLIRCDQHIAEAEKHISDQQIRIRHLREHGHDVKAFEDMLVTFQGTLAAQRQHRELILERISQLETGAPQDG